MVPSALHSLFLSCSFSPHCISLRLSQHLWNVPYSSPRRYLADLCASDAQDVQWVWTRSISWGYLLSSLEGAPKMMYQAITSESIRARVSIDGNMMSNHRSQEEPDQATLGKRGPKGKSEVSVVDRFVGRVELLAMLCFVFTFGDLCPDHHGALTSRVLFLLYLKAAKTQATSG